MRVDLQRFNSLPPQEAERELLSCCSAPRWARQVSAGRPYASVAALRAAARSALDDADLDAALDGHPRIGDRRASGASRREQSGVAVAGAGVLSALEDANRAYAKRFGHVYLVCAAGHSAEDLLATLQVRLDNDPATERGVVLAELAAINEIRLDRLGESDSRA